MDLFVARENLLRLTDEEAYSALGRYMANDDFEKLYEWRQLAADRVLAIADVRPGAEMGDPRYPRALCPLCKGSVQARDVLGYAVPTGLRRHLLGEMNSEQCVMFEAAEQIGRDGIFEARELAKVR